MQKAPPKRSPLRRRAGHFGQLVRHSAMTPRTGQTHLPKLVSAEKLGVTFIGHSSFFIQIGGQNVVIDPNFARWLFVLKRLRQPGVRLRELPPIDLVLVTHAHFDHLHRPSLRAIAQQACRRGGEAPRIIVPHHVRDLVADLGFKEVIELNWWHSHREADLTITHVPSRHWGARILRDSYRGYGGYVMRDGAAFYLSRWGYRVLFRIPRNWRATPSGSGIAAYWRLQSRVIPECAYQPQRCGSRLS